MRQQINLYQPIFRKQKKVFSAIAMLQITGFFIVVLGGIYLYSKLQLQPFREELGRNNEQFLKLTERIEVVSGDLAARQAGGIIKGELERAEAELERINLARSVLTSGAIGNNAGFSAHLEALAESHVNGAWLTSFNLAAGGRKLTINGVSIDPELVPVYIKRLAEAEVFDNSNFNTVELERSSEAPDRVLFVVATGE